MVNEFGYASEYEYRSPPIRIQRDVLETTTYLFHYPYGRHV